MINVSEASQENHKRFVNRVVESGEIWVVLLNDQLALCTSNEGLPVIPFWSDRAYAKKVCKDEWAAGVPANLPLDGFLFQLLPQLNADGVLVGTNWDQDLVGKENVPVHLAEEILGELGEKEALSELSKWEWHPSFNDLEIL